MEPMTRYDVAFVIEKALGHATHADNLRATIGTDQAIRPHWALIPFETFGISAQIPFFASNWTVRAGIRARRALGRLSRQARLDAVFIHTQVPALLCTGWLRRLPGFVSLDATPIQYDALGEVYGHRQSHDWLEAIKWRLNRRTFMAALHLIAWSEWARQSLVRDYRVPEDKVTVIPPGVDIGAWRPRQPVRRSADDPVKILFVGGNLARKGGLLLLEAFRSLQMPEVELHVVTRDEVEAGQGVFVYRDMAPNEERLKALYHRCDVFVLPTYGDCLALVLLEAAAAGLAIISTDLGGISEIVRDGETGLIVPVGERLALAEALRALIGQPDLRARLAQAAMAHVAASYDAAKNARRLVALISAHIADVRSGRTGEAWAAR